MLALASDKKFLLAPKPRSVLTPEISLFSIARAGRDAPPVAGYTGWWDASDSSSVTVTGSGVSQWNDKSGSGNHLTQSTDASRPPYTRTVSGFTVPDFQTGDFLNNSLSVVTPFTVLVVFVWDGGDTDCLIGRVTNDYRIFQVQSNTLSTWNGSNSDGITISSATTYAAGIRVDSAEGQVMRLGETTEVIINQSAPTTAGNLQVGRRINVSSQDWDGACCELFFYPSGITSPQMTLMLSWLSGKWGVTV